MQTNHSQTNKSFYFFWITAWLAIFLVSIFIRPIAPIDETRYVGTAWEMWLNHHWITLTVNGQAYGNKAPLLYWFILWGWKIFGVNGWWPRLVPALFGLASLFALHALAKKMLPERVNFHWLAPTLLLGLCYWSFYIQRLMFDLPLIFFILLSYIGLMEAIKNKIGWILFLGSLSVGILLKGPVIYIYVLPPALLAPFWIRNESIRWNSWYFFVFLSVLASIFILGAWVLLALRQEGMLAQNLIHQQIVGRINGNFGHIRAWWYYFIVIPGMLMPWIVWPPFWRALSFIPQKKDTHIVRFCFSILIPVFLIFCFLVGTKQDRYILPLYPVFSLMMAYLFLFYSQKIKRRDQFFISLFLCLIGLGLALVPKFYSHFGLFEFMHWIENISPIYGMLIFLMGIFSFFYFQENCFSQIIFITVISVTLNLLYLWGVMRYSTPYYDLRPVAYYLKKAEENKQAIASEGRYQDELTFLARLHYPIQEISDSQLKPWSLTHKHGWIIGFSHTNDPNTISPKPFYYQPYLDKGMILLWRSKDFLYFPGVSR